MSTIEKDNFRIEGEVVFKIGSGQASDIDSRIEECLKHRP